MENALNAETPRKDHHVLSRMVLIVAYSDSNFSPASLLTHGERIVVKNESETCEDIVEKLINQPVKGCEENLIQKRTNFGGYSASTHRFNQSDSLKEEKLGKGKASIVKDKLYECKLSVRNNSERDVKSGQDGCAFLLKDKSNKHALIGIETAQARVFGGNHSALKGGHQHKTTAFGTVKAKDVQKKYRISLLEIIQKKLH